MMDGEKVVMADQPLISYPPLKRIIKLEIPSEEQQEVNGVEEENWTLQVQCLCLFLLLSVVSLSVVNNTEI